MKLKLGDAKYGALLIAIIFAVIATLLFVMLPGSENLTVAYVFCLVGIALMEGSFLLADARNVPASYALIGKTGRFLPVSLILSIAVVVLERIGVYTLSISWHVVLQTILLLLCAIPIVKIFAGAAYIDHVDEQVAVKRNNWGALVNQANVLVAREQDAEIKAMLKKVADALRFSDPMGVATSADIEIRIETKLEYLHGEDCKAKCEELLRLIQERNAVVKAGK